MKESLIFRILEYGMTHKYFQKKDIINTLGDDWSDHYFQSINSVDNQAGINTIFYQLREVLRKNNHTLQSVLMPDRVVWLMKRMFQEIWFIR